MTARSALYVPGDAADKLAKALGKGADELIVDLEDAVPQAGKEAARATVASWLDALPAGGAGPRLWVRINPGEQGHQDLRAVVAPGLTGVCVAKAEDPADLEALDALLTDLEPERGITEPLRLIPLLESGEALFRARELARAPRVVRLQLGEADLAADLGVTPSPDGGELLWARSQVVAASAAARIDPPIAPVSTDFRNLEALRESTWTLRRLGFWGRACIHPAQIAVVHEVFTPTEEELAKAKDVLDRYGEALAAGSGVCLDAQGRLIDEAVVRSARRLLS
ncbi:citrate lyase subunit beta / citryl-CoA lyase [Thermomonospora echinospora]|uniref:Citrate lyase subunit beta / citryl-CoA lyase n=1 Tax=Thermomonospora echinospora TaxID=1992 RepID=A0A1H5U0F8_9ACTN|nr:CoA ester lyase [Thermomonospora echinospora]SEF68526.1 citrate lyase subunit beta / citryl-CoA lyase [Thermomonospora echinospora]